MKKLFGLIPYIAALAVDFYVLPLLINDTGSGMLMMLCVIPLIDFFCSFVYGIRQGSGLLLTVAAVILFAPTIPIFYNETAWIYIVVYAVITLVGSAIGRVFCKASK
ncbi:hypothetical protein KQI82_11640 [Oscillibacter sp. MSJ-2]|uniref:Uncharacterized protein n=1 Tax=Dysosmobacter acutus TaxID=2841504 RepID=A0ABS6FB99_9FIRM|nr:hypothetical protein [Dysosmobacter acutus]MBU5627563.1 hypothetical protein [Dysosmobacter acutus]